MKNRKGFQRIILLILVLVMVLSAGTESDVYAAAPKEGSTLKSDGNTYKVTKVKSEVAFHKPSGSKTTITIPKTVKVDGITYKVTSIAQDAFRNNKKIKKVLIGDNVKEIGAWAFMDCSSLESVRIPERVTEMGWAAFSGCSSLKSITIPKKMTYIVNWAFSRCSSLRSITIPEGVTEIRYGAFSGCSSLKSITIPKRVTYIGSWLFENCKSLKSINIPKSVKYIEDEAFSGCKNLKNIYYAGSPSQWKKISVDFGNECLTNATLHCGVAGVKLQPPSLTVKLNSANGVKLSWKKVSGAQGYYIYRSTSKNSGYKQIKKQKGTSYVNNKLKSGKTYYYKVAAYKGSTLSAKSKAKSKKIIGNLKTPKLKISADKEHFTISWNSLKGADKIEIFRETGNGGFKRWKTVPAKNKKVSYSCNSLEKGVEYHFALRAYYSKDGQKIKSGLSNAITFKR